MTLIYKAEEVASQGQGVTGSASTVPLSYRATPLCSRTSVGAFAPALTGYSLVPTRVDRSLRIM